MKSASLEQKLQQVGNAAHMLRNSQIGPYVYPIPPEFSNWRDEQESWRETAVLFDQSYHMTDLYVEGPDVVRLLSDLGVNSFKGFGRNKAKQFLPCNYDGYVIGDAVLFALEDNKVNIVGRPPTANWVEFHAKTAGYNVNIERDARSLVNPKPRKTYRYQLQGPNAVRILEKLHGGPLPEIKFFNMGEINIAGRKVRALKHGMSGAPGLEFWGPAEEGPQIKAAVLDAGCEYGLKQAGGRAYATVTTESGWLPSPVPAVYTGDMMKAYREWLPADSFEATASLGGSFYSNNIEDYYLTPWDLGYGSLVKFDHDFIGRRALEEMVSRPHRKKVILSWNSDDVIKVFATLFQRERAKYMEIPASHYTTHPYDAVMFGQELVGLSTYPCYTSNGRRWISLAMIDESRATSGSEVTVIWGEKDGGSAKPVVERHVQMEIRATAGPWPFADPARAGYRPKVLQP